MECYKIENLNFTYPKDSSPTLSNINFTIKQGEFITVMGKSGCGKTTFLHLLKPMISPNGKKEGIIEFFGKNIDNISEEEQVLKIGFVMQNPESQIVTDKVWHELAFGLENLGIKSEEIRGKVAETASFFGIQNLFHKKTSELSGGQKQILNLASVMVTNPDVLLLDEPTSQLDPIATREFFEILKKINIELGTTIIISEHRLEELFSVSDKIAVMEKGTVIIEDTPKKVGDFLRKTNSDLYLSLPSPMRIYGDVENKSTNFPLNVKDAKEWLFEFSKNNTVNKNHKKNADTKIQKEKKATIEIKEAYFRYEKNQNDVIKGLNLKVYEGELFSVLGGNGTGKTTALSLISGLNKPYRGKVLINGKNLSQIPNLYTGVLGVLPQNPQMLFVKKNVKEELLDMFEKEKISFEEKEEKIKKISDLCQIEHLFGQHPYDLSGGEQQRVALAKILLKNPQILLLDEPTKGMDAYFKEIFANILSNLNKSGVTIIMVSHDIEFCAKHSDRCAMFFDGNITSYGEPLEFFKNKNFYTTNACRIAKNIIPNVLTTDDIIYACNHEPKKICFDGKEEVVLEKKPPETKIEKKKISLKKMCVSLLFTFLFVFTEFLQLKTTSSNKKVFLQILTIIEALGIFTPFLSEKNFEIKKQKSKKSDIFTIIFLPVIIVFTVLTGTYILKDKKYYFISLLIITEIFIPFIINFEKHKQKTRKIVSLSVLCAIAVVGREAFVAIPQFKPVMAIVIITGIVFGAESGFLVGALSAFLSNFMFGQGPWTPWQMISFGIIGFLAGIIFEKSNFLKTKFHLCIFGGISTFFIYGIINNISTVIIYQQNPTLAMFVSACIMGIPFDLVHAISTVFFLWFISEPMIEKLERIKIKYDI